MFLLLPFSMTIRTSLNLTQVDEIGQKYIWNILLLADMSKVQLGIEL